MYLTLITSSAAIVAVWILIRRLQPGRFGLAFGLFSLYLAYFGRMPLTMGPMLNGLSMALLLLLALSTSLPAWPNQKARTFRLLIFAYMGVSLVGVVGAVASGSEVFYMMTRFKRWLDPLLFGLLGLALGRDRDRKFTLSCMVVGYSMVAFHSVRQGLDYGAKRIPGLLGHPNETGAFLASYAPIVLAIALFWAGWKLRFLLLSILATAAWGLVALESRGSMIGFAVGILALLFGAGRRTLAGLGLAALLLGYAMPGLLPARVADRFAAIYRESPGAEIVSDEVTDPSGVNRMQIWGAAVRAILHNPFGFGLNQFKSVSGDYGGIQGKDAHNYFLLVGVELGVVGLILVVGLLVLVVSDAWTLSRHGSGGVTWAIGTGVLGMVGATIIVNLIGSRLMQPQPSIYFWVLAGMTVRLRDTLSLQSREEAPEATPVARAAWQR